MTENFSALEKAISTAEQYAKKHGLLDRMRRGVLVAFSGGADSTLLLHAAVRWAKKYEFLVFASHVHHGIRGAAADGDLSHCEEVCGELSVPLSVFKADVPHLAKERGVSLETCARDVRYAFLRKEAERLGVSSVLVAHNSSDQAETVLFHLLRGSGLRGLCGISPWRDGVARPLLCLSSEEIREALNEAGISYTVDSTNSETDVTRNYLRHEVMPRLERVVSDPERAICRVAENLRSDRDFLEKEAEILEASALAEEELSRSVLCKAPRALAIRVLSSFFEKRLPVLRCPEKVHLEQIMDLLCSDRSNFLFDLPGGARLYCDRDRMGLASEESEHREFSIPLKFGENVLPDGGILMIGDENNKDALETKNVYKLFIQVKLSSATIENGCVARSRRPSDSYRVGGHRHSVKKLLNEAKVPLLLRRRLPILEDGEGIVWVPCLKMRDGEGETNPITASYFINK